MHGPIRDLLGHQAWADAMFFRAWQGSGHQEDEDLRIRMDHLVVTQEAFLGVFKGTEVSLAEHPIPTFQELRTRCQASHQVFQALGLGLDGPALARQVRVLWFPDPPCIVSVFDALLQVCMHSQHHRGQCLARLRVLGASPKNVDYLIWLWKQKPEGRWD